MTDDNLTPVARACIANARRALAAANGHTPDRRPYVPPVTPAERVQGEASCACPSNECHNAGGPGCYFGEAGEVFVEEPDDAPAYQDAYEWEPVAARLAAQRPTPAPTEESK